MKIQSQLENVLKQKMEEQVKYKEEKIELEHKLMRLQSVNNFVDSSDSDSDSDSEDEDKDKMKQE